MRYAMCDPSAEIFPWKPRGNAIGSSTPPAAGTVQKRGAPLGDQVARVDENMIDFPSAVQPWARAAPGCHAKRFGSPPSARATDKPRYPPIIPSDETPFTGGRKEGM